MSLVKVGRSCSILRENSREAGEGELMKLNERLIPLPKKELKSGTSPVNVLFAEAKLHCKVAGALSRPARLPCRWTRAGWLPQNEVLSSRSGLPALVCGCDRPRGVSAAL